MSAFTATLRNTRTSMNGQKQRIYFPGTKALQILVGGEAGLLFHQGHVKLFHHLVNVTQQEWKRCVEASLKPFDTHIEHLISNRYKNHLTGKAKYPKKQC
jgi:hypothetical protein